MDEPEVRRVGRYEVERLRHSFATDCIYDARDPVLGRPVELKVQNVVDGKPLGGPLLENEATVLAQLGHPGIVAVHDAGRREDGAFYLVTEHLDGGSLEAAYRSRTLVGPAVVRAVADAAAAVGYAHRRGFVHRNATPRTIHFDAEGRVRVLAFSLSTRVGDADAADLTAFVANAAYAAPEQLTHRSERIGPATDVWSLGVTLFEGLAGSRPFGAEAVAAMAQGVEPPPLPPWPAVEGVPAAVEAVLRRCLAADPADRWPDGSQLADALRGAAGGPATPAGPGRVFVSHASLDREVVERDVVGFLERNGVPTWYAKADIPSASQWERTILGGLATCAWFLLVMSPRSAESRWVRREVFWAVENRADRIVPVLLEACDPWKFHMEIPLLQHVDLTRDLGGAQRRLLAALATS